MGAVASGRVVPGTVGAQGTASSAMVHVQLRTALESATDARVPRLAQPPSLKLRRWAFPMSPAGVVATKAEPTRGPTDQRDGPPQPAFVTVGAPITPLPAYHRRNGVGTRSSMATVVRDAEVEPHAPRRSSSLRPPDLAMRRTLCIGRLPWLTLAKSRAASSLACRPASTKC